MPITHKKKRSKPQTEGGMFALRSFVRGLTGTSSKVGPAPTPKKPFDKQEFSKILSFIANNHPYRPIEFTEEQLEDPSFQEYKLNYAKEYYERIKNDGLLINYYKTYDFDKYEEMNTIFNHALYWLKEKVKEEQRQKTQFDEEQAKKARVASIFKRMQTEAEKRKEAYERSIYFESIKIKYLQDLKKSKPKNEEEFTKKKNHIRLLILQLQNDIDLLKDKPEYSKLIKGNRDTIEILEKQLTEILPEDELNILTLPTAPQHSPEFGKVGGKREPRRTKTSSKTPKSESSTRPSTRTVRTVRTASAAAIATTRRSRRSRLKRKLPYSASGFGVTLVSAGILNADINTMKPPFSKNITQEIINDYANRYRTRILDNSLLQNYYNDHEENLEKENRHIYNFALNIYLHPERYHGNNK